MQHSRIEKNKWLLLKKSLLAKLAFCIVPKQSPHNIISEDIRIRHLENQYLLIYIILIPKLPIQLVTSSPIAHFLSDAAQSS